MRYRTIQFQPTSWRGRVALVLGSALALALAVAFVVLTLGIALLLLPVVAILVAIGWWRWRRLQAAMREQAAEQGRRNGDPVIEIDYEVLGDPDSRRRR
ncbi:MAG: hypothetical protein GY798_21125 [Hyphomicrobiales bacterium]|nr:hypothetical protein [Hyphomicrobiales bacterium]